MMSRSAHVAIAAAITAAALACAQAVACAQAGVPWLSDAELKVSFAGHTIEGVYPDGRPYYAMRFIRGESLKEAIRRFHEEDRPSKPPSNL